MCSDFKFGLGLPMREVRRAFRCPMTLALPPHHGLAGAEDIDDVRRAIVQARRIYYEEPAGALAEAIRCHELARTLGSPALCARGLALALRAARWRSSSRNRVV
jgi:hypothetical protein